MSTIRSTHLPQSGTNGVPIIPPLEQGDHLTREEFHRRYEAMPQIANAELIEGVVHIPTPLPRHNRGAAVDMITWLGMYSAATPGTKGGARSTIILDAKTELQPETLLAIKPNQGGQMRVDEEGYIDSPPEWIGEIAWPSDKDVLHSKLEAYRRNRVQEYVVWPVALDNAIDWFALEGEQFVRLPCESGIYRSRVFPGLWLDVPALLSGNLPRVFEVVQQGAATAEHGEFVNLLQQRGQGST